MIEILIAYVPVLIFIGFFSGVYFYGRDFLKSIITGERDQMIEGMRKRFSYAVALRVSLSRYQKNVKQFVQFILVAFNGIVAVILFVLLIAPLSIHRQEKQATSTILISEHETAFADLPRARALVKEGRDLEKAEQYLLKAIDANPNYINSYEWLVHCYNKMRNYSKAREYLTTLLEKDPHNKWGLETRKWLRSQGEWQ